MSYVMEIRGQSNSYRVYHQGRPQGGNVTTYAAACARALAAERRLHRQNRLCICCGRIFTADGAGIRMCKECKR